MLAEMGGLRILRMNFWWMFELGSLVKPGSEGYVQIAKVTRPRIFEITLPPTAEDDDDSVFEDLPCTVIRKDES